MSLFNREDLEKKKEILQDHYHAQLEWMFLKELRKCFEWFVKHYPKRDLRWVDAMGRCFWVLDGEILHWEALQEVYTNNGWSKHYVDAVPDRYAKKLLPLWDFYQLTQDVTYMPGHRTFTVDVDLSNWKMLPTSGMKYKGV